MNPTQTRRRADLVRIASGIDVAVKVLVAVADVDALVEKESPIDKQARFNTTSVYTATRTLPMLPARL